MMEDGVHFGIHDDCKVWMHGWVDAQNGFGAQIRTYWTATLTMKPSNHMNFDVSDVEVMSQ